MEKKVKTKVAELTGRPQKKGDVGLELEIEGHRLPTDVGSSWVVERDSSLKASEAYEYVLNGAKTFEGACKSLSEIRKVFDEVGAEVYDTKRGSVHVHINVSNMYVEDVRTFVALGYMFESALSKLCGEDRENNLFCLRSRDAEAQLSRAAGAFRRTSFRDNQGQMKYAFMNICCIDTLGTLEFRGMTSNLDVDRLTDWMATLLRLRDKAKSFDQAEELMDWISVTTVETAMAELIPQVELTPELISDIWEDVRRAQEFIYDF